MEARIIKGPEIQRCIDEMSLGQFFFAMSQKHGDKIAQIDSVTDQKQTFNDIRRRSVRAAIEMSKRGITAKDVVVFCTANSLDNVVPLLGASYLGAKVASLDPTLSLRHVKHLLNIVKPTLLFVEPKSLNLLEQAIENLENSPQIVIFGESSKYPTLNEFTRIVENENQFKPVQINSDEPAILFFSSGTTGLPKAICLSSKNILHCINGLNSSSFKLDALLHFTTLYWMSGIRLLIGSFFGGGYRIIAPTFDPEQTFRIIEKYRVTLIIMAPGLTYKLTSFKAAENFDTSSLGTIMIGGTPLSPKQLQKTRTLFKYSDVILCYGMTEAGFLTFFTPHEHRKLMETKLRSCGRVTAGVTIKIVEPDTNELLPPYQTGEICCKSPGVMLGYYNADSSCVFDKDGFLKTGDVGYYDEDDCIYVVERIKEMFKYQSWHIVPSIIEMVLLEHPAIAEACVFGVPHEEDGEVPAASIVLKNGMTVTTEEISEFVAQRVLDREKLRAGIVIVKSLPKTPSGKLIRREAKSQVIEVLLNKQN